MIKGKLVLCGHSLGGVVAALATLAILRVLASSSPSKEPNRLQVKCITFSQPPVGNTALREHLQVQSVRTELREHFQSRSMKSYRAGFQKIYDMFMCANAPLFTGIEQLPQFSHLQELLGLTAADSVELGHIVEAPTIRTATSILPLGWNGCPGGKSAEPLKVDIIGNGLHMCTLWPAFALLPEF